MTVIVDGPDETEDGDWQVVLSDDLTQDPEPTIIEFNGPNAEALAAEYADLKRRAFEGIA